MSKVDVIKDFPLKCIIADYTVGLGKFDQESDGYPIIDEQELYNGNPTYKVLDVCGIQAHAGYYLIGSGGNEFEFNIDEYPFLNLTIKAKKDTDTCLMLMVHDSRRFVEIGGTLVPRRGCLNNRFVIVGKTPKANFGEYVTKNSFTIIDDIQWHEYTYDLRKIRNEYPNSTLSH
jgi:hypothetical protein